MVAGNVFQHATSKTDTDTRQAITPGMCHIKLVHEDPGAPAKPSLHRGRSQHFLNDSNDIAWRKEAVAMGDAPSDHTPELIWQRV